MKEKSLMQGHNKLLLTAIVCCAFCISTEGQGLLNRIYIEDRPTMLFSSVIADHDSFNVIGVISGSPNNGAKGMISVIDVAGTMGDYKAIGDSVNVVYGLFWNSLIKNKQNQFAFTGYAYDSIPSIMLGLSGKNLDSISIFKYYTPQTGAFQGYSLLQYDDSSYYIAGVHTPDVSPSNANVLLMKVNKNGQRIWEKYYNQYKQDFAKSIIKLDNGNFMLGAFRNDLNQTNTRSNTWLLEVDVAGNIVRQWFDPNDSTYTADGLLQTKDGGFIYGAQKKFSQTINALYLVATVVKLDNNFNKQWSFVDGRYGDWTAIVDIEELPDGSFIGCGNKPFYKGDSSMISGWIVKLSANGNVIWNRTYAGLQTSFSYNFLIDIDVLEDGSLIAVGQCQNLQQQPSQVGWFLKLDSNGCEIENCLVGINTPESTKGDLNSQLQLYPNPFTTELSITLHKEDLHQATFTITNLTGRVIYNQQETNLATGYTKKLDLTYFTNGVYFVTVTYEDVVVREKVVKY